jgi:ParB family chromosome partitioning protein
MFQLKEAPEQTIIFVPLSNLNPVANGVRKTNGMSIDELAASIRAEGLIQNLTVYKDPEAPLSGAEEFERYIVTAGSRRLKALRKLAHDKFISEDHPIPCRVVAQSQALTVSTAENVIRAAMHPADEFVAFREMIDQGQSVDDIAVRFGVDRKAVEKRLKLANVSPKIFELFRTTSEITLEQMMALALSDDHKAQEQAWFKARGDWQREPQQLRAALTKKEIGFAIDPIARFVGRKAYEEAGGSVHDDLFNENGGYATDATLLRTLAAKRLNERAEQVRKEGWSAVEIYPDPSPANVHSYNRADPIGTRKPDDAERKRLSALESAQKQLQDQQEKLGQGDDSTDEYERIESEIEAIQAELRAMEEDRKRWDPKVLAKGIAIVTIERGMLRVHRGLIKGKVPQSKPEKKKKTTAEKADVAAGEAPTEQAGHSQALVENLSRLATYAVQAELIAQPGIAVIALTHKLIGDFFYAHRIERRVEGTYAAYEQPVKIARSQTFRNILNDHENVDSPDVVRLDAEHAAIEAMLPKKFSDLLAFLLTKTTPVPRLLAYCVALSVDGITNVEDDRRIAPLAEALNLNMATRWTAKADNYLSKISADSIRAAMADAGASKAEISATSNMKKQELIATAAPLLGRTNWLPKFMRFTAGSAKK